MITQISLLKMKTTKAFIITMETK